MEKRRIDQAIARDIIDGVVFFAVNISPTIVIDVLWWIIWKRSGGSSIEPT